LRNPFECLSAGWADTVDLPLSERAMVEYLVRHHEAWSDMGSQRKAKYRALVRKSMMALDPLPVDVFENEKNRLSGELAALLGVRYLDERPLVV
jgi:hypothetical protein